MSQHSVDFPKRQLNVRLLIRHLPCIVHLNNIKYDKNYLKEISISFNF